MMLPQGENAPPPSPELLAAYADGEFEGCSALRAQKRYIEDWLEQHPEEAAELLACRRLKQQWQETTPEEPTKVAWDRLWQQVEKTLEQPPAKKPPQRGWQRGITAATILLAISVSALLSSLTVWPGQQAWFWAGDDPTSDAVVLAVNDEPFPVASEDEVHILHVETADAATLVVGLLPVTGPLVLPRPGDVVLHNFEPYPGDNMLPDVHLNQGIPMIWARSEREMYDP